MASVASGNCMWLLGLVSCSLHRVKFCTVKHITKGELLKESRNNMVLILWYSNLMIILRNCYYLIIL